MSVSLNQCAEMLRRNFMHDGRVSRLLEDVRRGPQTATRSYASLRVTVIEMGAAAGLPRVAGYGLAERMDQQAAYVAMRMDGESHTLAEMFALQEPPMSNTDREFLEGHCNGNQFADQPHVGDYYAAKAKAAGVDITGKVYMSGLATEPGDVRAWVSGRGDVERIARERGMSVQGSVNVKAEDLGPPPEDVTVADDLVDEQVRSRVEDSPELALRDPGELRAEVREAMKPHWGD